MFDGVCNFCNFWVNFTLDRDKKDCFRFAALQSEAGQKLLRKFNLSKSDFDTFILVKGETYFTKSTAALKIANHLSGPVKILTPLIFIPRVIRDIFYNIIASNRYRFFGKRDVCRIPSTEERLKFISDNEV